MKAKLLSFLLSASIGTIASAQSAPPVPAELIGTWATAPIDCTRNGPTTLLITATTVIRADSDGNISGSRLIGRRSVEVDFEYLGPDKRDLGSRMFRLSTDGLALFEISAGKVVATRRKCAPTEK